MKKVVFSILSLFLLCSTAMADPSGYGFSLGYGEAKTDIDIYRVGIKKDFSARWFKTGVGYLSGYFELSYNRWEWNDEDINAVAFSPVFVYYFGDKSSRAIPYIEGGIGGAYLDEYRIGSRNLASNLQFEDRVGVGVRTSALDLNFRYMHYSNGSLEEPNQGIDILLFTVAFQF